MIALSVRVPLKYHGQVVGLDGFQVHCESPFSPTDKADFPLLVSGRLLNYEKSALQQMRDDSAEIYLNSRRYKLESISQDGAFQICRDW
jgi:hypothetical protein